jgi:hypothetical protein
MKLAGSHRRNTFIRSLLIPLTTAAICNLAFSEEALNQPTSTIKVAEDNQVSEQQEKTKPFAEFVDHHAANQN